MANNEQVFSIRAVDRATDVIRRVTERLERVSKPLEKTNKAFEVAERSAKRYTKTLEKTSKALRSLGTKASLGITLPVAAIGTLSIRTAADFELGMNKVKALTRGEMFDSLKAKAQELGRTTQFSATEAADAMGFLAMAGFKANEIYGSLEPTLLLATAAQQDLATSADIVSNVMTGYRIPISQIGDAVNKMSSTFTGANTNLVQLGEAMKLAGPIASSMKIPFQETLALVGSLGNAGFQGSIAGTALAGGISRLIKPVKAVNDVLSKLGIKESDIKDSMGNLGSLTHVLELLERQGASTADYIDIFGQEAGKAFIALKEMGVRELRRLEREIARSSGRARELADEFNSGAVGAMRAFRSAVEAVKIAIADSGLLKDFTEITNRFTGYIQKLSQVNPALIRLATILAMIAAAIGPLLFLMSGFLMSMAKLLVLLKLARVAVMVFGTSLTGALALLTLKIGLVVGAVSGISYAIWFVWKNWKQIIWNMSKAWEYLKENVLSFTLLILPGGAVFFAIWKLWQNWELVVIRMQKLWNRFTDYLPDTIKTKLGIETFEIADIPTADIDVKAKAEKPDGEFSYVPEWMKSGYDLVKDAFSKPIFNLPAAKVSLPSSPIASQNLVQYPEIAISKERKEPLAPFKPAEFGGVFKDSAIGGVTEATQFFSRAQYPDVSTSQRGTSLPSLAGLRQAIPFKTINAENFDTKSFNLQDFERKVQTEKNQEVLIVVDFKNIPKGVHIQSKNDTRIPLQVNMGFAMDGER